MWTLLYNPQLTSSIFDPHKPQPKREMSYLCSPAERVNSNWGTTLQCPTPEIAAESPAFHPRRAPPPPSCSAPRDRPSVPGQLGGGENHGVFPMGKWWFRGENHWKTIGKWWKMGKTLETNRKIVIWWAKPWENHGKMVISWRGHAHLWFSTRWCPPQLCEGWLEKKKTWTIEFFSTVNPSEIAVINQLSDSELGTSLWRNPGNMGVSIVMWGTQNRSKNGWELGVPLFQETSICSHMMRYVWFLEFSSLRIVWKTRTLINVM